MKTNAGARPQPNHKHKFRPFKQSLEPAYTKAVVLSFTSPMLLNECM